MKKIFVTSILNNHFVIIISSLILFLPILKFSFLIGWDDQIYVLNSYTERGLTFVNLYSIITDFYFGQYAPLNQLIYSTLYEFFGYTPFYFHAFSIFVHVANGILTYLFIRKITKHILPTLDTNLVSLLTTILFLVAPVNVEPVAWVAALKVLLYACFYLLSLLCYLKYIEVSKPKFYYFTIFYFVLSFASKEQAMTLPMAMIIIDYIYKRDLRKINIWMEKFPLILLSLIFILASFQSQGRSLLIMDQGYGVTDRILLAFYTTSEYFTKILLPINLSYIYPFPFSPGESRPFWIWFFPFAIITTLILLKDLISKKHIFFGFGFFLIHIIMVTNIVSLARYSIVADRYAYIASIGLFWLVAINFTCILDYRKNPNKRYLMAIPIIYILYLIIYTSEHMHVWQDAQTLKRKIRTEILNSPMYEKPEDIPEN
jgi:hypothetical protein